MRTGSTASMDRLGSCSTSMRQKDLLTGEGGQDAADMLRIARRFPNGEAD